MAIFKAATNRSGKAIGRASPQKLEDYLKYKQDASGHFLYDEDGKRIPRTDLIGAINADADDFSFCCKEYASDFNVNRSFTDVKYKHYIQGFAPEDSERMTERRCHELGMELARTVWKDFPVLVVTHCDQLSDDGSYHWHNHFLVYNCNVTNGRKLDTSAAALKAQKRFVAAQADANGLSRRGLRIDENGRIKESTRSERITLAEHHQAKRYAADPKRIAEHNTLTQKAELRLAIRTAVRETETLTDFRAYLQNVYGVQTKETRGVLSYLHPDRAELPNGWIRGRTLGSAYSEKEIFSERSVVYGIEEFADRSEHRAGESAAGASASTETDFPTGERGAGDYVAAAGQAAAGSDGTLDRDTALYRELFREDTGANEQGRSDGERRSAGKHL